jgi:hypothetical protein
MIHTKSFISTTIHKDLLNTDYVTWRQFLKTTDGWTKDQISKYQLKELQR